MGQQLGSAVEREKITINSLPELTILRLEVVRYYLGDRSNLHSTSLFWSSLFLLLGNVIGSLGREMG